MLKETQLNTSLKELANQFNRVVPEINVSEKASASAYRIVSQQLQLMAQQIAFLKKIHASSAEKAIEQTIFEGSLSVSEKPENVFSPSTSEIRSQTSQSASEPSFSSPKNTPIEQIYPMSSAQRRLFVLSDLVEDGEKSSYQIAQAFIVEGKVDTQRLEYCLTELFKRHDILRTCFHVQEDDTLVQQVQAEVECKIVYQEGSENEIDILIDNLNQPFDLTKTPLLRIGLVSLSINRYLLLFETHHIIIDGLSWNIFIQELTRLYHGESLVPLQKQYRDYVTWHNEWLTTEKTKKGENYWRNRFADEVPVLNLPTDYPRPQTHFTTKGSIVYSTLLVAETTQLKDFARANGVTLNMLLLAIYNVLLHKLTGQEDIIIGSPTRGRPPEGFEQVLGMFANTIAQRNRPKGNQTFKAFLQELKVNASKDYDYQEYPFEILVDKLDLDRVLNRNALFDVMFVYERAEERVFKLSNLTIIPYDIKNKTSTFDLTLEIIEQQGVLNLHVEYNTQLFKKETIERWNRYLKEIVRTLIDNPNQRLSDLEMISVQEKHQLLVAFNETQRAYPLHKTLVQLFEEQVEKTPTNLAVIFEDIQLTYRELNQKANGIAHFLRETYHIQPEDRVGLLLGRSEMMIVGLLGILKAGSAYVPVDIAYPTERIVYILEDSGCKLVLTETEHKPAISAALEGQIVFQDISSIQHTNDSDPKLVIKPENLAYILYTSGSTGKPKGVLIEHCSLVNMLLWRTEYYPTNAQDKVLQLASYAADTSIEEIFSHLVIGATLVLFHQDKRLDTEYLGDLMLSQQVTHFIATPSFYKVFLHSISERMKSLRFVVIVGEALDNDLVALHFKQLPKVRLFNGYGPTENSVNISATEIRPDDDLIVIGTPVSNNQVYILNQNLCLCPIGVAGEICVSGNSLARGYLNRPEVTADKFVANPFKAGERMYRTGDLGCRLADGHLVFLGRVDDQVKIRGFRVELGEIEKRLLSYDAVKDGVVIARKVDGDALVLVAYIIGEAVGIPAVRKHLENGLPNYMIPSFFVKLDKLPLTTRGKIDKKALPNPDKTSSNLTVDYAAPRNAREEKLVQVWEAVLKQQTIGIHDNYFSLGGDSIKAIQIVSRLRHNDLKLLPRYIFQYPTIAELALQLTTVEHHVEQGVVTGEIPLTAIQQWLFTTQKRHHSLNHFNQAVMLDAKARFEESAITAVLAKWQEHHDALRMVYHNQGQQWLQENGNLNYPFHFETLDLKTSENTFAELEACTHRVQASINLSQGPLMKAVLFRLQDHDRLLIAIHHLVIDGVSWRILLEDFVNGYEPALSGKPIKLPPKTSSFKSWAEKIQQYSRSEVLLAEQNYWNSVEATQVVPLPTDYQVTENCYKDITSVSLSFSQADTDRLLTQVNPAYNTTVVDILLTALAKTLQGWHGENQTLVTLEGHGREPLFEELDISRTVGWFTSEYPVILTLPASEDLGYQIKVIKETLRQVPNKGFGYGILRYLATPNGMSFQLTPQISFNYLGVFEDSKDNLFELSEVSNEHCISPALNRMHYLDIECLVVNSQFQLTFYYNHKHYKPETINQILLDYQQTLLNLMAHCQQQQTTELTPADLTYSDLSMDDLDDIFA